MSSRESDNANPTPRRTGPDAYPSGTPPYGTPGLPGGDRAGADAGSGGEDDGPKTETTLTTRVRINIPGSRPIPPVVVRSTVKNETARNDDGPAEQARSAEPGSPRHRSAPASPVLGVMDGTRSATPPNLPPEWQIPSIPPATSESESTGAWFRPRQKKAPAAEPAPAAVAAGAPSASEAPAAPGTAAEVRPQSAPNGARPAPAAGTARPNGRPLPGQGKAPAPAAPASPYGAGAPGEEPGVYEAADPFAPVADPFAPTGHDAGARGPRGGRPQQQAPRQGAPRANGARPNGARPNGPQQGGLPQADPLAGPNPDDTSVDGFAPIRENTPPPAAIPGLPRDGVPRGADDRPQPGLFASAPTGADPFATQRPAAPGQDPFATPAGPGGLFPGAPQPAAGGPRQAGRDPEATEVTPLPTPAPGPGSPAASGGPGGPAAQSVPGSVPGATPVPPPGPAPAKAEPAAPAKAKAKRGGAKKLVKLGVYAFGGVLFLGAAAYGTGLMLNQSDVPKGTVVLGTDIGGNSRDQAIHALDASVGKAGQQPLKLKIGDQTVDLDPTVAGLTFDTTATVDGLAAHDYNPVAVIESIQGGTKAVAPEVRVDRAKLKAALDSLAAGSGQGLQEGYVKFADNGDPVVVPGKAGQAVDSNAAMDVVEQAYRDRAAGKPDQPIALAVTAAQPKVSTQALQAAADSLGKQVTNGKIHLLAGTKPWDFGAKTAAKALTLAPDASGKIAPKWDLDALNSQLNGVFDKVKIKKNGQTAAITPQDVADAVTSLFDKTGDKERTYKFTVA
ncbi:peptidoglycan binding domain-containing protein [Kitasatospora cathayae]|uniref:Peptidoglycan binding domain-containing protein n=1 Tax=Kitasatospora cathayae TaxID=3004092 RepID=A0ABY7Q4W1_9ACTN|nr:peptidoglycan binding domain-containing protein [Kitasatospora sp. HUAS 3-15]WBP87189.1 peptidoglycan binding domain-containing protein [Kitasatospora sp. HUAS 3-15]